MPKRLADKNRKLNNELFNFLENLLVFRTLEKRSVPSESGVKFHITRKVDEKALCFLVHIDDQGNPIFDEGEKRPDYLAIYLSGAECICTIIEMKGKDGHRLSGGLKQIKNLEQRLKSEFRRCLPRNFQLHIQGLLLCPPNSQIPLDEIIQRISRLPIMAI